MEFLSIAIKMLRFLFQFENQYMVTPEIRVFRENPAFRREFMDFLFSINPTVRKLNKDNKIINWL